MMARGACSASRQLSNTPQKSTCTCIIRRISSSVSSSTSATPVFATRGPREQASRLTFPFQLHHSGHPKGASEVQNILQATFDISLLHAVLRV